MSLYGKKYKIDGVPCGLILRDGVNGQYKAVFEREYSSLEDIEAINWAQPAVEGDSPLPAGYGFTAEDISYTSANRAYTVTLQVAEQYLGDVTGYAALVKDLETKNADQQREIAGQKQEIADLQDQLAETDEALIALYEAQEAQGGEQDAQDIQPQDAQVGGEVSA